MGSWAIHIEGHGIHDNNRPDDVDALLAKFVEELGKYHSVSSATLTIGSTRTMLKERVKAAPQT